MPETSNVIEQDGKKCWVKHGSLWVLCGMMEKEKQDLGVFDLIKKHFSWGVPIISVFCSFLGILSLWAFSNSIGRPDIFMPSLDFGAGLFLLVFAFLIIYSAFVLIFSISVFLFIGCVRDLGGGTGTGWISIFVMLMVVLDMVVIALFLLKMWNGSLLYRLSILCLFFVPLGVSAGLIDRYKRARKGRKPWETSWWRFVYDFSGLSGCILAIAILNLIVSGFYFNIFNDSEFSRLGSSFLIIVLAVSPLLPSFIFYVMDKRGRLAQAKGGMAGFVLFNCILAVCLSGLVGSGLRNAVQLLGVSDPELRRYLLDDRQYPVNSLPSPWEVEKRYGDHLYSVKAFSLYAYGSINLLCPSKFKGYLDSGKIREHSRFCIVFQKEDVRKLDGLDNR